MDNKSLIVQRANVVLRIAPEQADYYTSQGYNIIDAVGNVIKASVPRDLGTLQKAFIDHVNEIGELKSQIENLKIQIENFNTQKRSTTRKKKDE